MWPYRYAYNIPLVTLILNLYGFVGLVPFFFLVKIPFLALFYSEGGVAIYTSSCRSPGDTDSKYIWVLGSNFNHSIVNLGHTDRQTKTNYLHFIVLLFGEWGVIWGDSGKGSLITHVIFF